jgi:selenocysteine-specific translation elongation factor
MPLVVGTAGHIDHGKTWLVRALTGKDTDRLPEEHERGISIDLGYAPLDLDGMRLSLVDVPGHGRTHREAPEIDGVVLIPDHHDPGAFVELTVVDALGPDLVAAP